MSDIHSVFIILFCVASCEGIKYMFLLCLLSWVSLKEIYKNDTHAYKIYFFATKMMVKHEQGQTVRQTKITQKKTFTPRRSLCRNSVYNKWVYSPYKGISLNKNNIFYVPFLVQLKFVYLYAKKNCIVYYYNVVSG